MGPVEVVGPVELVARWKWWPGGSGGDEGRIRPLILLLDCRTSTPANTRFDKFINLAV